MTGYDPFRPKLASLSRRTGVAVEDLQAMTILELAQLSAPFAEEERRRDAAAEAYFAEHRDALSPVLSIRCPRRHLVAAVYDIPDGRYLWCKPKTLTPRDLADNDDPNIGRRDWPNYSGRLGDPNASWSHRAGCRCSVWLIPDTVLREKLAARRHEVILSRQYAWHSA